MIALAVLCALAGLLPGLVLDLIAPAVGVLAGARLPPQGGNAWLSLVPGAGSASYNGLLLALFVALSAGLAAWAARALSGGAPPRRGPAWGCGFTDAVPLGQYGPASFAQPIRRVLAAPLLGARETVFMPPPGSLEPARHTLHLHDPAWVLAYAKLAGSVDRVAGLVNAVQFLTIRRYLGLVFAALVGLLLVLAVAT